MRIPIVPRSWEQLEQLLVPRSPEVVPWWFYDTQTYTDNSTTQLTFFGAAQADRSLSNLEGGGGMLPHPNAFEIHYLYLDVINAAYVSSTTAATENVGNINDVGNLVLTGRSRYVLNLSDKRYGPFPVSTLHATGGASGMGWGTTTAEETLQYGYSGSFSTTAAYCGAVLIPPRVSFNFVFDWPAAVDLVADAKLRLTMFGAYYRRVA